MTEAPRITTPDALAAIARNTIALGVALGFAREAYLELEAEYEAYREAHPDTPTPPAERVLLEVDFSNHPVGPYTRAMAQADFGWEDPPSDDWWAEAGVTIATSDGRSALTVTLEAGTYGGGSGPVFFVPIESTPAITFTMESQFAPGFEGDMGGKLPGFGTTIDDNVNPPTGGAEPTKGNTCRHMWRNKGEAGDRPPNAAACYTYHPSYDGEWGDYEFLEAEFTTDAYSVLTTHAEVNTPGARDGILRSRLGEGPWTLDLTDYEWMPPDGDPEAWQFNRLAFAVFRGGSDAGWASDKAGKVQFRRFRITAPA